MLTVVPSFILAFLGATSPGDVQSWLVPQENLICYQTMPSTTATKATKERGVCLPYTDEGTHLIVHLNEM